MKMWIHGLLMFFKKGDCFVFPHLPRPLLFAADDFSSQDNLDDPEAGGWDATLVAEEEEEFFELQIVKHHDSEVREAAGQGNLVF